jgi:hypothetical protein
VAYIGNDLQVAFSTYKNIDDISGSFNSVTTSFALLVNGSAPAPLPLNSNQCLISVGGVVQRPDDTGSEGFRLSGGNIIFSSAPNTGEDFFGVVLAGADYVNAGANFPDGTLAAPSITFDQDNDTGYYRSGSGSVSFAANGVAAGTWSSAGVAAPALIPTGSSVPANGVYLPSTNNVAISTNGTGRLFIDSSGQVGLGTSSPGRRLSVQNSATGTEGIALYRNTGDGTLMVGLGQDADGPGQILVNTTNGDTKVLLRANGASYFTGGNVGIGTTSPGNPLHVSGTGVVCQLASSNNNNVINIKGNGATNGAWLGTTSSDDFIIANGASVTERARIDSSGRLLVGTSTTSGNAVIQTNLGGLSARFAGNTIFDYSIVEIKSGRAGSGFTGTFIDFKRDTEVTIGSITGTTSAVAYNTSSDYRLKENLVPLTGAIDRLQQIPVHRFNFIADPDKTVDGFIAHEAQVVVPECVTGTKDETKLVSAVLATDGNLLAQEVTEFEWESGKIEDEEGNSRFPADSQWVDEYEVPVYQGIDQSKLVPLLTAALQEAIGEIASLKDRVTALEAQ